MIGVLDHDSALSYTGPGSTWSNEMNFVMNHVPGAESITWPVDQYQVSNMIPAMYTA